MDHHVGLVDLQWMTAHWPKVTAVYDPDYGSEELNRMAENHPQIKLTPESTIFSTADRTASKSNDEEAGYDYCD